VRLKWLSRLRVEKRRRSSTSWNALGGQCVNRAKLSGTNVKSSMAFLLILISTLLLLVALIVWVFGRIAGDFRLPSRFQEPPRR
jgi:cell division septal protein FtsQ